jgi:NAD(P)-dependent dehydrogenase (short-subunit alcohol dehydrogenase family)
MTTPPPGATAPGGLAIDWDPGSARLPGIGPSTVALITGGTGAIGLRLAEAFAALGARVAITSRSADRVAKEAARLGTGGEALGIRADVADPDDARAAVSQVTSRWGRLDVLVQCAALGDHSTFDELDVATIDALLATNVKGVLLVAQAAAVPMTAQGRGRIINVASIMAHRGGSHHAAYGASKAAVVYTSRSLSSELGPHGITVNSVSPGSTPTMLREPGDAPGSAAQPARDSGAGRIPLRRRGHLDDYVGPILFLASDLARYVTGADILIDGGLAVVRP